MTDKSIAEQIAALEVHIPRASLYRQHAGQQVVERRADRKRRKGRSPEEKMRVIFDAAEQAALLGKRCPTSDECADQLGIHTSSHIFSDLAAAGRIRIEVTARNWRTVWICAGEHRGKHTMLPTPVSRPYLVLGPDRP